jgi:hypothetical protein
MSTLSKETGLSQIYTNQNISVFVNHVVIVFWGPNERDRKRTYIPRLFSEYMLTFRVEEPMKMLNLFL